MATTPRVASDIKDPALADRGRVRIEWAGQQMPVLGLIRRRFEKEKPFRGLRIAACLHITTETANLALTLRDGGAEVTLCASNPLSTQDDNAASLVRDFGIPVFAIRGEDKDTYYAHINAALDTKPHFTMDDGCDLVNVAHTKRQDALGGIRAGTEETTTGVIRLRSMVAQGDHGLGAQVIVTEVDPTRALEAAMEGYRVLPMSEAARLGNVFVTATGDRDIIGAEHLRAMKDGAVLANSGHFNIEIDIPALEKLAKSNRATRDNLEEYTLADGRLVYLAAAEGHPASVMDMSFANQALSLEYLARNAEKLEKKVYPVPVEIDRQVARLKLEAMGIKIDTLTPEQEKYLASWSEGT